ncbi:MAG: transposase [Streptosporangiaceae bacterium]
MRWTRAAFLVGITCAPSSTSGRPPAFTCNSLICLTISRLQVPVSITVSNATDNSGAELAQFYREREQVHLLVDWPPAVAISRLADSLKGASARRRQHEFPREAAALQAGQTAVVQLHFADSVGGPPSRPCATTPTSRTRAQTATRRLHLARRRHAGCRAPAARVPWPGRTGSPTADVRRPEPASGRALRPAFRDKRRPRRPCGPACRTRHRSPR